MPHTPPVTLITGATSGIGLALARQYAARGERLVLVGRRPQAALDPALFTAERYCQVDLAQPGCETVVEQFVRDHGISRIDRLIHTAALSYYGAAEQQPNAAIAELLAVNVRAPIALTYALLPYLWRARGTLAFVSSVAAALPLGKYAVYVATRAAIGGFARSLRAGLGRAITVQVLYTGPLRSALPGLPAIAAIPRAWLRHATPEHVGAQIVTALERRRPEAAIGAGSRVALAASRAFGGLLELVVRRRHIGGPGTKNRPLHYVITGAADGIGKALAQQVAAKGYAVTGIDVDRLRVARASAELAAIGGPIAFICADLSHELGVEHALEQLQSGPAIDVLVHCASVKYLGQFAGSDLERQKTVLDVNLLAPQLLTAGLLRRALIGAGGKIVFVASLSWFTGYPGASVYAASKAGLTAYARCLGAGLARRGIDVLTVFPSPLRLAGAAQARHDLAMACAIASAAQTRRRMVIPGVGNRLLALLGRCFPSAAEWFMRRTTAVQ